MWVVAQNKRSLKLPTPLLTPTLYNAAVTQPTYKLRLNPYTLATTPKRKPPNFRWGVSAVSALRQ